MAKELDASELDVVPCAVLEVVCTSLCPRASSPVLQCCPIWCCDVEVCPCDAIRMDTEILEMAEPYREILYDREHLTLLGDKHEPTRKGMGVPSV